MDADGQDERGVHPYRAEIPDVARGPREQTRWQNSHSTEILSHPFPEARGTFNL